MIAHPNLMSSTIDQYRDAKSHYLKLRTEAKKDLLRRFQELANELLLIQRELMEDFGHKVSLPTKGKRPKKTAAIPVPLKGASKQPPAKVEAVSPKEAAIHKQLEKARKKLAETQAAAKPTKALEDRIYELEDELRLAQAK
jgi:hypothetical protein